MSKFDEEWAQAIKYLQDNRKPDRDWPPSIFEIYDTVEKLRGVGNTDLHPNSTCCEFKEQSVETAAVLVDAAVPCHDAVSPTAATR